MPNKFHRQNFKLSPMVENIILYLIVLTGAKSPLGWAAAHRAHHQYSDTEKDPHSPKHKGFWYSIDTVRDKKYLESLIKNNKLPWEKL